MYACKKLNIYLFNPIYFTITAFNILPSIIVYKPFLNMSMKKIFPSIDTIQLFYPIRNYDEIHTDERIQNGAKNIIRENIITILSDLPEEYAADNRWIMLRHQLNQAIQSISPFQNYTYNIIQKAGRKHNYDFEILIMKDMSTSTPFPYDTPFGRISGKFRFPYDTPFGRLSGKFRESDPEIFHSKVEFKYCNNPHIDKLPQIYQRSCMTSDIFKIKTELFPLYYYRNGLTRYCEIDPELRQIEPPEVDAYLKMCKLTTCSHPLFIGMKTRVGNYTTEKNALVNSAIEEYIREYSSHICIEKVSNIIQTTQRDKIYLMWDAKTLKFYIDRIPPEELIITRIAGITKNTIIFQSRQYYYHFLLRWKNGKGMLNPAWQISVKKTQDNPPVNISLRIDEDEREIL